MRIHTAIRYTRIKGARAFTILAAFVSAGLLMSCGGGGTPPPVPQTPDFSISASTSSASAQVGTTVGPVTVSVNGLNGFSGSVSVAVSGLPTGITSSPAFPLNINANSSVQVTFTIPANAPTGNFAVTIQATSGSLSHNWPLTLTLTAPPPDFSISVSPSSVSTQVGTTSTPVTVSVTGLNGFSGSVSVAVSGLPAGIVCSPSCPLAINANSSMQVSFVVPANAATGNLALTVQGTSGNLSHNAPLTLGVTAPTYTISGTISGLAGTGLILQANGGNNLPIEGNGVFSFVGIIAGGSSYSVTVFAQPSSPSQTCVVTNGSGPVTGANITGVQVTCTTNTYTIGGTISGLAGTGLVLQDNGGNNLPVTANGTFTFTTAIANGGSYNVTVFMQPSSPSQNCVVSSGSGPVTTANITSVQVVCTTLPPDFSVSVSPSSICTRMGTTSAPVTVSVTGLNGFSGSVSVAVTGLPSGIVCSPSCPLAINANSSAQVAFVVPANASTGSIALTVQGTSGNLSHSAPLTLDVTSSLQGFWNLWTGSAVPQGNPAPIGGHIFVSGWGFESTAISAVTVFVDNGAVGNAFYGTARPGLTVSGAPAPLYCGFSMALDTTKLSNGTHTVSVEVTDSVNNVTPMENYPSGQIAIEVNVNNAAPVATGPVANLRLNAPTTSLTEGTIVAFTASATDGSGNPVSPSFSWASTDTTIVKVTPTGAVLPLAPGNATISVSAGGKTQQVAVTVQAGSGAPGTIQVSLGPEEVVFQYTRDGCMEGDVPDGGARAVRLSDGSILLIAGAAPFNFADVGPDFWSLKRRCAPTLVSGDSPLASTFQNWEWIYSLYDDGTTIHALVHNEFHDPIPPNCQPVNSSLCQYNSITYAFSTDGGHTFQMNAAPQNVVAPPPVQFTPPAPGTTQPFFGYQEPTNIVHAADGYYYARFGAFPPPGQPYYGRNCVMRTQNLSDPTSWRAWDGTAFELQMTDPYTGPGASLCANSGGSVPYESLTYNTYLNNYMLVGLDSDFSAGGTPINCGFHFSLSSDLVNWSTQQFIAPAYVPAPSGCQQPGAGGLAGSFAYGSIIDPDDPSTNFETPGRTPYIYYTRFNDNSENRDLVRVPALITKY